MRETGGVAVQGATDRRQEVGLLFPHDAHVGRAPAVYDSHRDELVQAIALLLVQGWLSRARAGAKAGTVYRCIAAIFARKRCRTICFDGWHLMEVERPAICGCGSGSHRRSARLPLSALRSPIDLWRWPRLLLAKLGMWPTQEIVSAMAAFSNEASAWHSQGSEPALRGVTFSFVRAARSASVATPTPPCPITDCPLAASRERSSDRAQAAGVLGARNLRAPALLRPCPRGAAPQWQGLRRRQKQREGAGELLASAACARQRQAVELLRARSTSSQRRRQ